MNTIPVSRKPRKKTVLTAIFALVDGFASRFGDSDCALEVGLKIHLQRKRIRHFGRCRGVFERLHGASRATLTEAPHGIRIPKQFT